MLIYPTKHKNVILINFFFLFSIQKDDLRLEINGLLKLIQTLEQNVIIAKTQYDDSLSKDQLADRHFRLAFGELVSPAVIDQAHRIFK